MYKIQILSLIGTVVLFLVILHTIKTGKVKIRYAILWMATCLCMFAISIWKPLIDSIARSVGIYYPPSVLFLIAFLFLLAIVFHFSIVISSLADRLRRLTEDLAILEERLKK